MKIEYKITSLSDLINLCKEFNLFPAINQPVMIMSRVCELLYRQYPNKKYAILIISSHEGQIVSYDDESEIRSLKAEMKLLVNPDGSGESI